MGKKNRIELWLSLREYLFAKMFSKAKGFLIVSSVLLILVVGIYSIRKVRQKKTRKFKIVDVLLILESSVIIVATLWGRTVKESITWEWQPFLSYGRVVSENSMSLLAQIILNIVIFVPLGILLPCCFKNFRKYRNIMGASFLVSIIVEVIQGVTRIGWFELDDIINNLLGVAIGILVYHICQRWKIKGKNQRFNSHL